MAEADVAIKPEFKIISSGTHATQAAGGVTLDAPPEPEKAPAETAKPAEKVPESTTTTETNPAADGNAEQAKPNTTAKLASSTPATPATTATEKTPAQPAAQTWEDILKANGFDESFLDLAKSYKAEGNIDRYVQAKSTDFSKMTPEQVLRVALQREYPAATPEQLESLYDSEVMEKYKLDPDTYSADSKEAKAGRIKMEMDALKLRNQFTADAEKLKLPSRDLVAEQAKQQEQFEQSRLKDIEDFMSLDYSKSVMTDKRISLKDLGPGIPDFHIELDNPEMVRDILFKPGEYSKYSRDAQGNPDSEAQFQGAAFMYNRKEFVKALINYGKSLGKEEYVEEKFNPPGPKGTAAVSTAKSLQEAFAANGKSGKAGN